MMRYGRYCWGMLLDASWRYGEGFVLVLEVRGECMEVVVVNVEDLREVDFTASLCSAWIRGRKGRWIVDWYELERRKGH